VRADVRQALAIGRSATLEERTIDITTAVRRSGEPRRIEIVFYCIEDSIFPSGIPGPGPRAWLLNLSAEPRSSSVSSTASSPACRAGATVITDPPERRRMFIDLVEDFDHGHGPGSPPLSD